MLFSLKWKREPYLEAVQLCTSFTLSRTWEVKNKSKQIQKQDSHGQSFGPLQVCYVSWNSIFGPAQWDWLCSCEKPLCSRPLCLMIPDSISCLDVMFMCWSGDMRKKGRLKAERNYCLIMWHDNETNVGINLWHHFLRPIVFNY